MSAAFTDRIDAVVVLYCSFWLFFIGLIYYLRREDKREGYPLEPDFPIRRQRLVGFPEPPPPKTYRLLEGGTVTLPNRHPEPSLSARLRQQLPGAPLYPVGEPLLAGIGPGAYALRRDEPFRMLDGSPQLAPLRNALDYTCVDPDMDPRGRRVLGDDKELAGVVTDIWVDKGSCILRYVEVQLLADGLRRLVPIFSIIVRRNAGHLTVDRIRAAQMELAPVLREPDLMTPREEDRINGFFAGGSLYAVPNREALY